MKDNYIAKLMKEATLNCGATLKISVIIISFCVLLSGCTIHRTVRLDYTPEANSSVRSSAKPVTIALEIIDQRPPAKEDMIGRGPKVIWVVENGTIPSIEVALKSVLENKGHNVVKSGAQDVQVFLSLRLIRFWAGNAQVGGGWAIDKCVEIQADVEVSKTGQGSKVIRFPVRVEKFLIFPLAGPGGISMVVNPAFNEFIENVAANPDLIAVLENN